MEPTESRHYSLLHEVQAFADLGSDEMPIELSSAVWALWADVLRSGSAIAESPPTDEATVEGLVSHIVATLRRASGEGPDRAIAVSLPRNVWAFTIALVGQMGARTGRASELGASMEAASNQIGVTSIVAWRPIYLSVQELLGPALGSNGGVREESTTQLLKDAKHELEGVVSRYEAKHQAESDKLEAAYDHMQAVRSDLPDRRDIVVEAGLAGALAPLVTRDKAKVAETLASLRDVSGAEDIIRTLLRSRCREYRDMATEALTAMGADVERILQEEASGKGGTTDGCFVATACFGSPSARQVILLRDFRDQVLIRSWTGRLVMRLYYLASPPIAWLLRRSDRLKRLTLLVLLDPMVNRLTRRR